MAAPQSVLSSRIRCRISPGLTPCSTASSCSASSANLSRCIPWPSLTGRRQGLLGIHERHAVSAKVGMRELPSGDAQPSKGDRTGLIERIDSENTLKLEASSSGPAGSDGEENKKPKSWLARVQLQAIMVLFGLRKVFRWLFVDSLRSTMIFFGCILLSRLIPRFMTVEVQRPQEVKPIAS